MVAVWPATAAKAAVACQTATWQPANGPFWKSSIANAKSRKLPTEPMAIQ